MVLVLAEPKLCECGCGQEVRSRFVSGHNMNTPGARGGVKKGNVPWNKGNISIHFDQRGRAWLGRRLYHRVVMEEKLGRPLLPEEVVHHINGDHTDNRPENLQVVANQSAHMIEHHRGPYADRSLEIAGLALAPTR